MCGLTKTTSEIDLACGDPNFSNNDIYKYLSSEAASSTFVCFQSKILWLLDVDDTSLPNTSNDGYGPYQLPLNWTYSPYAYNNQAFLTKLPGIDTLNGSAWGNITLEDIVIRWVETP